jgi:hypothetical protein
MYMPTESQLVVASGVARVILLFEFMQANPGTKWRKLGLTSVIF